MPPKLAFYPCCATDIEEPRHLLSGIVDEIIFCDIREYESWEPLATSPNLPQARFVIMDVRNDLSLLPQIDVFFYRRDSNGEGGSGVFLLSKTYLDKIMRRMNPSGGLLITDGSNRGNGIYKKMLRAGGYTNQAWGKHFQLSPHQDHFEVHGLKKIEISPAEPTR
ncbi:hypothetical protein FEM03_09690 [Phragmitibacter flavus]|uniref:Rhodanese domain-containing protein n=2 Tax=Phragmitibacter flavus TaxID=2576071 RepID=A0A5R8KFT1_9BACT|nr:hypothetical protein FEM03_09690 [Phragmitibacter flavus]